MHEAIPYESRSRLRDRRAHEAVVFERQTKRIVFETSGSAMSTSTPTAPDKRRMRGIPMLAKGVTGEQAGTRPDKAAVWNVRKELNPRAHRTNDSASW
jgi:hypothetical protein